jgi:single-stranded-DNA-specific exonuclease
MSWEKKAVVSSNVREISNTYSIDLIIASILERREASSKEDIKFYLESDLVYLHNPYLFDDMEIAVDRILQAVEEGEKVRIFGDRDVDGITSTVLLHECLEEMGIQISWCLPEGDEPYGLTKEGVRKFAEEDGTLIITVDCGISNNAEIAFAASLNIDTIVVDHHLSGDILPPALALINPKIEGCGYPFPNLAGCGVVAKLIWALRFSKTELYKQEMVLLHAEPGNGTVIIQAAKFENLVETDRLTEEIVPGLLKLESSRLADFLLGHPILVYNRDLEQKQLRIAFGDNIDIHLVDTAPEIWKIFPSLSGKSLVRLMSISRSLQYKVGELQEIDAFISLFASFVKMKNPSLSTDYSKILDLVAIGTIADLMPMKDENRILVKNGMAQLNSGSRAAMVSFLTEQNLIGKKLSTTDIGWQVSPVFNAAGRLGVPQIAAELLLGKDAAEREKLAKELIKLNKERKKIGEGAWERMFPKAVKSLEEHNNKLIVLNDKKLHRGITGIISARLLNLYHVPSIVIAHLEDKLIGSIRSNKMLNAKEFLSQFEDILIDFGGHPRAAGFSIQKHNLEILLKRINYASRNLGVSRSEDILSIDAEIPSSYMNPDLIKIVETLEPYGEEHRPLQFLLKDAVIEELSIMGNSEPKHVKMLIKSGSYKWPAVFWRAGERLDSDFSRGDLVDLVFRLGRNYFRNAETLQLTILDLARAGFYSVDK